MLAAKKPKRKNLPELLESCRTAVTAHNLNPRHTLGQKQSQPTGEKTPGPCWPKTSCSILSWYSVFERFYSFGLIARIPVQAVMPLWFSFSLWKKRIWLLEFSHFILMTSWKIVDGMKGGGLLEEGVDLVPLVAISVGGSGTLSHWWLSQPAKPSSPTTSSCCLQWTSSTVALSLLFVHIVFNACVARVRTGARNGCRHR